jgi:hypothetical protein
MSTDVSEVRAASIIRAVMIETERISETSVDIQLRTQQYIPEDSELHTRRRENFKSHTSYCLCRWGETVSEQWPQTGLLFTPV